MLQLRGKRQRAHKGNHTSRSHRVASSRALLEGLESRMLLSGIQLASDVYPGSDFSAIDQTTAMGGKVYFADWFRNLYAVGGSGTSLINVWPNGFFITDMVATSNRLFLRGAGTELNYDLWTSDGTSAGTVHVSATGLTSDDGSHFVFGDRVFFAGKGADGTDKPWVSDGTAAGTYQLADVALARTTPVILDGQLYFMGGSGLTYSLYKSDGTPGGTSKVWNMPTGNAPDALGQAGGQVLAPVFGHFYAVSPAGTATELAPLDFTDEFATWKGVAYFAASGPEDAGTELWRSDGTVAGTYMVKDINPGPVWSNPGFFAPTDSQLLFIAQTADAGYEWWATDGTAAGTHLTRDTIPGPSGINISMVSQDRFAIADNVVYFPSEAPDANGQPIGPELWQTDGTAEGTRLVQDLNPGSAGSWPSYLCTVGQTVYFQASSATVSNELFSYAQNILPVASITGPMSVGEYSSVKLGASGTDPDGSVVRWEWDFDYDGQTFDVDATGQTPTFSAAGIDAPATRTIAVRAVDDIGALSDVASGTLGIVNMAPAATFAVATPVYVGRATTTVFTAAHDSSPADTAAGFLYSYDFNNDGVFEVADSASPSVTIPASYFLTAGSYSIGGRIADQRGAFSDYSVAVSAIAIPVASAGGPYNVNAASSVQLRGSATAGAGLSIVVYQWDLNYDGITFDVDAGGASPVFSAATLNGPLTRTVALRVKDSHGTISDITTSTVNVANVAPTSLSLSNTILAEHQPLGTVVGTLSGADPGAGSLLAYSRSSVVDFPDNAWFTVDPDGTLRTAAELDYESGKTSYAISMRVTDEGGLSLEKAFTITVTDINEAPAGIALSSATVAENQPAGTVVGTLSAMDFDTIHSFTYWLTGGAGSTDNALFAIDALGRLKTAAPLDFETQRDYSIRLCVTDQGGLDFEKVFAITVTDTNDAPVDLALSAATIEEQKPAGTVVGSFTATDPDSQNTFRYQLTTGPGSVDNMSFSLDANGTLRTAAQLNYESGKTSYAIRARVTDQGGLSFERAFTITVLDVPEAPTGIALSSAAVAENQLGGAVVGSLTATDPDAGGTTGYALVAGDGSTDNALFSLAGSTLKTTASFDLETRSSYSIRVRATDQGGLWTEQAFTINVTNVNEGPADIALAGSSVAENQPAGAVVGTLSTTDPDSGDAFGYSLVADAGWPDNSLFSIVGNTLKTAVALDYEARNSYSIKVRTTDAGRLSFDKTFTIAVTNANEAPTDLTVSPASVLRKWPAGTLVGSLSATDPDAGDAAGITYTLVAGVGSGAMFRIEGNQLKTNALIPATAASSYSIRVRATDAGGQSYEQPVTIGVTGTNLAPTVLALQHPRVAENQPKDTIVGTLTARDPNTGEAFAYKFVTGVGGEDNALFYIDGNTLKTSAPLDYEAAKTRSILVQVADKGRLKLTKALTVNVTDVNEAPMALKLSAKTVAENKPAGTTVGLLSAIDPDAGNVVTYTLAGDQVDNAAFKITATGQLKTKQSFDFETKTSYVLGVRAMDQSGLFSDKLITLKVTNVNEAPNGVTLTNSSVLQRQPVGTLIGLFVGTDPDAGNTLTYSLVDGIGARDNAMFKIVGAKLRTAAVFEYTTKSLYKVRVRVTDQNGLSFEQAMVINVTQ